jgi:hypothetical protein
VNGVAARAEPNGAERAVTTADPHHVAIDPEIDALAAKLDPAWLGFGRRGGERQCGNSRNHQAHAQHRPHGIAPW